MSELPKQRTMVRRGPQKRGLERRQQLRDAALKLLATQSFSDTTYQQIADEAGMPLASCYNFYSSKLDLVRHLADERTEAYLAEALVEEKFKGLKSWREGIERHVELTLEYHNRCPAELQIYFGDDVPLSVRLDSIDRERIISDKLRGLIGQYFELPNLPELGDVFFRAIEIGRTIAALEFQKEGALDRQAQDHATLAMTGYLSNFLPDILPPVNTK